MHRIVCAAAFLAASLVATSARAGAFQMLFDSDELGPSGREAIAVVDFPTYGDILGPNPAEILFAGAARPPSYSPTGLAFDGTRFHILYEQDDDVPFTRGDLFIFSYSTLDDIAGDLTFEITVTDIDVPFGYTTTGFLFDGSAYHILLESDADLPPGEDELGIYTYASFSDIGTDDRAGSVFTDVDVRTLYSTTGIAFDGTSFYLMEEAQRGRPSLGRDAFFITTYATLADLVSDIPVNAISAETALAREDFDTAGLTFVPDPVSGVPEPGTRSLLGLAAGLLVMAAARPAFHRRRLVP